MIRYILSMSVTGLMMFAAGIAWCEEYPGKPIRMLSSEAGGAVDFAARIVARALSVSPGWQMIVDNRSTLIGIETVAKAPPDAYTLLIAPNSFWIMPLLQNTAYDVARDFSPITLVASSPNVLVVYPGVPAKSVKELITLAKAKPGELNYASSVNGAGNHLAAELFKSMAGVNMVRVPYKGIGLATNDLIGGHVQVAFPNTGGVIPHLKSGRLRGLAVTSAQPSLLLPDLPTIAASLPGFESVTRFAIFAPAKTPSAAIKHLNEEIVRAIGKADVKEAFAAGGAETQPSSPQGLATTIKSEVTIMGKVIKDAGIRVE